MVTIHAHGKLAVVDPRFSSSLGPVNFLSKYLSNFHQNKLRRWPKGWTHAPT
jgi:hypothetical protein